VRIPTETLPTIIQSGFDNQHQRQPLLLGLKLWRMMAILCFWLQQIIREPESEIRMLTSLQAYLDESADKERRIFSIGGFIGRADEWTSLLLEWIDRIRLHRLPHPIKAFHMTDCEDGGREFRNELGWDDDSRRNLIIDLLEIICKYNVALYSLGMPIKEYELLDPVNPEKGLRLGHTQYHFLFQSVIPDLAREMDESGIPAHEDMAFFFDQNSPHEFWANKFHKDMQKHDPRRSRMGSGSMSREDAARALQQIVAKANHLGFVPYELEPQLALAEIELNFGDGANARSHLEAVQKEALNRGFGLIALKAAGDLKNLQSSNLGRQ
jgi:hypothetical protein